MKRRIAIFASGSGTNAEKIFEKFEDHPKIEVVLLLSNNPNAFALARAQRHQVATIVFSRQEFYQSEMIVSRLQEAKISFVVLAGFMWLVPDNLLQAFPDKIINIHPALLPKYGGKGMYGMHVHNAVVKNRDSESGITIHYVNAQYDEGAIIKQAKCQVDPGDSAEDLAEKIHAMEYQYYPGVIEKLVSD